MNIPDINLTVVPYTALYNTKVPDSAITFSESTRQGRHAVVLDFNAGEGVYSRDLEAVISWPLSQGNILRVWQPSLIPEPENVYNRPGDWQDGGYPGAKFIQGIIVEADSFNAAKTFSLESSDDASVHQLLEMPARFIKRTEKAFSCVPFVAHSVRRISTDGVAWRVWNERIVFQPYPEATMNWTSPATALGLTGWGHVREMNIAHISTAALTLTLSFDFWPQITLSIPSSGGALQKVKVTLPANKFKIMQPSITSTAPFRLFAPEIELKLGQWGRSDSYKVLKPFGGPNQTGAEV